MNTATVWLSRRPVPVQFVTVMIAAYVIVPVALVAAPVVLLAWLVLYRRDIAAADVRVNIAGRSVPLLSVAGVALGLATLVLLPVQGLARTVQSLTR